MAPEEAVFVDNMNQYQQVLAILEDLSECVEMKNDFPFERKITFSNVFRFIDRLRDVCNSSRRNKFERSTR